MEKIGQINYFLKHQTDTKANTQVTHSLDVSARLFQLSSTAVSKPQLERPADYEQPPWINLTPTHDINSTPERTHGDRSGTASGVSRLPKLNLPSFSGEPLALTDILGLL